MSMDTGDSVERLVRLWPRVRGDHASEQALRRRMIRDSDPCTAKSLRVAVRLAAQKHHGKAAAA